VTDLASEGLRLLSARSPLAIPILFGAGVVTSIGPCVAPRYVALTAIAQRSGRPWQTAAIFAVGVVSAYVALGMATGLLSAVRGWSTAIDAGLACALAGAGCITLLRDDAHGHAHPASRTTTRAAPIWSERAARSSLRRAARRSSPASACCRRSTAAHSRRPSSLRRLPAATRCHWRPRSASDGGPGPHGSDLLPHRVRSREP